MSSHTLEQSKFTEMTTKPVPGLIVRLAVPTIVSMLVTSLYNMADTYYMGKVSTAATAAVGIAFPVMASVQAFGFFFGHGSGNFISRRLGAGDVEAAQRMAATGFYAALLAGCLIAVLGYVFITPLCHALGATPTILPQAETYVGIVLLGAPFMTASLTLNNQMRFQGNAAYAMVGIVAGALLNIALAPLLIFVAGWGIAGAAIATVCCQFLSFALLLAMSRRGGTLSVAPRHLSWRRRDFGEIVRGGSPSLSRQVLACLAACFLWGSAFPCVKIGYELFGIDAADVPSILAFAGTRFVIAGLMVVAGVSLATRRAFVPERRDLPAIGALSLFQTVLQYVLFYVGLANCAGVTSSILEASNSFLCVLLAALVFRFERLTARKVIGCVIGFGGVLLVNLWGGRGGLSFTLMGEGMVLASTVAAATSSNLAKHFSADHDPVLLSGWQFVVGGAFMLVLGLAFGGHIAPADAANPAPAILLLAYLGFISAAAYSLWSLALAANPVSRVAVFGFMNPVFGVLLSAVLLDEASAVNPLVAVAALALVSAGIIIVNRPKRT